MGIPAKFILAVAVTHSLAACSPAPASSPYSATGEMLALSGGDGGPSAACHTCHGLNGEGDGNLTPRLAGLERGYLVRQLIFFAEGQREHAQMSWIARRYDRAEQESLAAYYSGMAKPASRQGSSSGSCEDRAALLYQNGDASRGLAACSSCHGSAGQGVGYGNPAVGGQPAPYLAEQLRQWRQGERYGDPLGAMRASARLLEDEEIEPLAAYMANLSASHDDPESPEECLSPHRPDPRNDA